METYCIMVNTLTCLYVLLARKKYLLILLLVCNPILGKSTFQSINFGRGGGKRRKKRNLSSTMNEVTIKSIKKLNHV